MPRSSDTQGRELYDRFRAHHPEAFVTTSTGKYASPVWENVGHTDKVAWCALAEELNRQAFEAQAGAVHDAFARVGLDPEDAIDPLAQP